LGFDDDSPSISGRREINHLDGEGRASAHLETIFHRIHWNFFNGPLRIKFEILCNGDRIAATLSHPAKAKSKSNVPEAIEPNSAPCL